MGLFSRKTNKKVSAKDSLKEMKQATARFEFSQANKPKDSKITEPKEVFNYQADKPKHFRTSEDRVWDFLFKKK